MTGQVRFLEPAERELLAAAEYYDAQDVGLGRALEHAVAGCVDHIQAYPRAGQLLRKGVRRVLVPRFPYAILYHAAESGILIVAIMNVRRRPSYWVNRI